MAIANYKFTKDVEGNDPVGTGHYFPNIDDSGVEIAEATFKAAKVSEGFVFVAKQDPADPA
jgi:hypothetical protein